MQSEVSLSHSRQAIQCIPLHITGGRDEALVLLYLMAITTQWISGRNYDGGHLVVKVQHHKRKYIFAMYLESPENFFLLLYKFCWAWQLGLKTVFDSR
ncbi:unnamed protein product [Camellia sinensis]